MHIQKIKGTITPELVRFYNNGCYANRDRYDAVLVLEYCDNNEVYIHGLKGTFNFKFRKELDTYLRSKGIQKAHREVKGKWITTEA